MRINISPEPIDEDVEKLSTRSTDELVNFRAKLRKIDSTRSWQLRFAIIRVLLDRYNKGEQHEIFIREAWGDVWSPYK